MHICATCALHKEAAAVGDARVAGHWPIIARYRSLGI
jgi:hypothetical protein